MNNAPPPSNSNTGRYSPTLIVLAIIPLLGFAAAITLLLSSNTSPSATTGTPRTANVGSLNQPMPEFSVVSLDGDPVDLSQYHGRPVFVNFWGTWCPPCVRELPELQAFAAAQGDTGAVVVASNNTETSDRIRQYFDDNGLILDDIVFVQDYDSTMYRWFGVFQMPTTFLVDAEGVVRSFKYGPFDVAGMQSYLDDLAASQSGG